MKSFKKFIYYMIMQLSVHRKTGAPQEKLAARPNILNVIANAFAHLYRTNGIAYPCNIGCMPAL